MHTPEVIKHVADAHVLRVFAYLIFVGATHALFASLSFFHYGITSHAFYPGKVG